MRRRLLTWYDQQARKLPWRRSAPDPYQTLVAEFMLQQTQTATVIPYYERFIAAFPRIADLAAAPLDDILNLWAGLGYYRRAHHLHRCAKEIVARFAGHVPGDIELLRTLPGVGAYTAGAVASIAFGRPEPCIDGNVRRVLTRALGLNGPATDAKSVPWGSTTRTQEALVESTARALVPADRPGDYNQAVMDLGSLICTPRAPRCPECPWRSICHSAATLLDPAYVPGRRRMQVKTRPSDNLSRHRAGRTLRRLHMVTVVLQKGRNIWFERRPDAGLWAGLWAWPSMTIHSPADADTAALQLLRRFSPLRRRPPQRLFSLNHLLTHRLVVFKVYRARWRSPRQPCDTGRWQALDVQPAVPISTAQRRMLHRLMTITSARGPHKVG